MDWAGMLERMYARWGERFGHRVSTLDRVEGAHHCGMMNSSSCGTSLGCVCRCRHTEVAALSLGTDKNVDRCLTGAWGEHWRHITVCLWVQCTFSCDH